MDTAVRALDSALEPLRDWLRGPPLIEGLVFPRYGTGDFVCKEPYGCYEMFRVAVASFCAYTLLMMTVWIVSHRTSVYKSLSPADKLKWCSLTVSSVHSFFAVKGAMTFFSQDFSIVGSDPDMDIVSACSAGYFAYDLLVMLVAIFIFKSPRTAGIIFHHIVGVYAFMRIASEPASWVGAIWLATEMSTPLVNVRWMLDVAGKRSSLAYKINGIIMVLVFFAARICLLVYFWKRVYEHSMEIRARFTPSSNWCLYAFTVSATLLDIMWFWQMVSGLGRVLYDLKRQKMVSPSADDKQKKTE